MKNKIAIKITPLILALSVFASTVAADRVTVEEVDAAKDRGDLEAVNELVHTDESNIIDQTIDVTVKLDENSEPIVKQNIKDMLGVQYETSGGSQFIVDSNGEFIDDYVRIADEMFEEPLVRWGGTSSRSYNLTDYIGPISQRKNSTLLTDIGYEKYKPEVNPATQVYGYPINYGPAEFIKAQQAINPDVAFIFCLSIQTAYPEDTANFIHFLVDDKDESSWGALRASCGIEEPVKVRGIELGNEMYFFKKPSAELEVSATQWYIETFKKHAEAIEEIVPDMIIMPCVNSNAKRGGWEEWNRPIVRELGKKYNYMAYHLYYSGYELAYTEPQLELFKKICEEELGEDNNIKIALTEHAKWGTSSTCSRLTLASALATGQFLNRMSQREDVELATYHCGISASSNWGFMVPMGEKTLHLTALSYLYKVYEENMGDRILKTTLESESNIANPLSTGQRFSVLATPRGNKELVLFLVNREGYTDINVNFETNNNYTLKKEVIFTAPNLYSIAYRKESDDVFKITETEKNEKNFKSYKMPTKSLVCLVLESDKNIGSSSSEPDDEPVYTGEKVFDDVEYNWAKNEINLLYEQGIVSGIGDNLFAPMQKIQKAEFAAMFSKALNLKLIDSKQIFSDVLPSDWYYDTINSLALNGYIRRGGMYYPNGNIKLRDCVSMIYKASKEPYAVNTENYEKMYAFYDSLSSYEKSAFTFAIDNGLLNKLYETSDIVPDREISRAESSVLIYRLKNSILK